MNSPILFFHRFFARNANKTVWLVSWQYREIITVTTISSFWDKLYFFHENYVFEKSPPLPLSKSSRILGKFAITFISQNKEISLLALNQRFTKIFPSNYFFLISFTGRYTYSIHENCLIFKTHNPPVYLHQTFFRFLDLGRPILNEPLPQPSPTTAPCV